MRRERKRRDKSEIYYEILRKCQKPTPFARLMESVSNNYKLLNSYLKKMEKKGLLVKEVNEQGVNWHTTEKGKRYIECYEEIQKLLKD